MQCAFPGLTATRCCSCCLYAGGKLKGNVAGPPLGMSPMPRMSHPPGQMQSPLNHTISDLNVSNFISILLMFYVTFKQICSVRVMSTFREDIYKPKPAVLQTVWPITPKHWWKEPLVLFIQFIVHHVRNKSACSIRGITLTNISRFFADFMEIVRVTHVILTGIFQHKPELSPWCLLSIRP